MAFVSYILTKFKLTILRESFSLDAQKAVVKHEYHKLIM